MNWKTDYRSFYYEGAEEPADLSLPTDETALLSIDVQNTYLTPSDDPLEKKRWAAFHKRMHDIVIPTT
ncbi:MAG: amidase, partial [Gammaproteobacteria bacterium]|nr:amidase [Gammaproteobacteria bacterium]